MVSVKLFRKSFNLEKSTLQGALAIFGCCVTFKTKPSLTLDSNWDSNQYWFKCGHLGAPD